MSTRRGVVSPARGEIWEVNLNPSVGREQAGRRPALIVSANVLNSGPRGLVVVIPVTGTARGLPSHVPVTPPTLHEPGLDGGRILWPMNAQVIGGRDRRSVTDGFEERVANSSELEQQGGINAVISKRLPLPESG